MVGIKSYGAYIPIFRMSNDIVSNAWGTRSMGGHRSVANYDEDSLTMAVEAALNCIDGEDRKRIEGVFFASTTSPYKEKACSSILATVADLESEIWTSDLANSLRAGTSALRAGINAVKSREVKDALVTVADCRLGTPRSVDEQVFGDGAAALLLGNSDTIATIEDIYSVSDDITDVWRTDQDNFVRSWEDRWVLINGYTKNMKAAISGIMKRQGLEPKDFAKIVIYSPDARSHIGLAKKLGFDPATQLQDPLIKTIGNLGAAQPLVLLVAALEEAKAGDKILLASYGDGSDAFVLQVKDSIEGVKKKGGVKCAIESNMMLSSYQKYLAFRQLVSLPEEFIKLFPSASVLWRTKNWALSFHGSKCKNCGLVSFPIQRVCFGCHSRDDFEEVRLSDKRGKVFTYSLDNLAGGVDPPTVQTIVESEEGGARIYCLMTDCNPKEVKVDMPVEMTFRRFHREGGFHNYFWKCRPVR
ncbi:MAG: 3-oxoacyl-[acyl-carrier-protein] synthase III C-terminal domain-containing protein [Thermodesulfobacteriota bacterium]|nr:3-oxoacyl-[acyl-carrier-protein] synthase III C-terminal domain-containing protein [Thermodesulfobacteriota bacterium]